MRRLDEQYTQPPCYRVRRMTSRRGRQDEQVNEERGRRLLRLRGLMALYPGAKTRQPAPGERICSDRLLAAGLLCLLQPATSTPRVGLLAPGRGLSEAETPCSLVAWYIY